MVPLGGCVDCYQLCHCECTVRRANWHRLPAADAAQGGYWHTLTDPVVVCVGVVVIVCVGVVVVVVVLVVVVV